MLQRKIVHDQEIAVVPAMLVDVLRSVEAAEEFLDQGVARGRREPLDAGGLLLAYVENGDARDRMGHDHGPGAARRPSGYRYFRLQVTHGLVGGKDRGCAQV